YSKQFILTPFPFSFAFSFAPPPLASSSSSPFSAPSLLTHLSRLPFSAGLAVVVFPFFFLVAALSSPLASASFFGRPRFLGAGAAASSSEALEALVAFGLALVPAAFFEVVVDGLGLGLVSSTGEEGLVSSRVSIASSLAGGG